ncbi:unnamed protein product, partial [Amoebophrya sp. A25]|eukprot:GSA25T00024758001.1
MLGGSSEVDFIGGRRITRVRQLSEGGFAFVYLAQDHDRKQSYYALKVMRCDGPEHQRVALAEIDFFRRIPQGCENLITCFGRDNSNYGTLLLELCDRGHLLSFLERFAGCQMPDEHAQRCGLQIAKGLVFMHAQGIQHRDLKIENILLAGPHDTLKVSTTKAGFLRSVGRLVGDTLKLCDFGSVSSEEISDARSLDGRSFSELEEVVQRTTTLIYQLVDLHSGLPISVQIDQWDLGCVLFTLAYGKHPFQDESSLAITNCKYRWPSTTKVGECFECLVHWLLAWHPSERPSSDHVVEILSDQSQESSSSFGALPLPESVTARLQKQAKLYGARIPKVVSEMSKQGSTAEGNKITQDRQKTGSSSRAAAKTGSTQENQQSAEALRQQEEWRARRRGNKPATTPAGAGGNNSVLEESATSVGGSAASPAMDVPGFDFS